MSHRRAFAPLGGALALAAGIAGLGPAAAGAAVAVPAGFQLTTFAGAPSTTPATVGPDDIARLDGHVFIGWQNGIGTKGEPNAGTGQTTSTIVEYSHNGTALHSWSITGKADGLGADPEHGRVIVTANEDGNSTLYTIRPSASPSHQVVNYTYSPAPDSAATGGVLTGGGTDAVSVFHGQIMLTASAPTPADATAVFRVRLQRHNGVNTANLSPTFADNATATDALTGQPVGLALGDPDSNAVVPSASPRFGGQFMVAGQADQQLVFARGSDGERAFDPFDLTRLSLTHGGTSAGTDDVRWTRDDGGTLYVVDNGTNKVYAVSGPLGAGQAFASLDTVGTTAVTSEVDSLDLNTGALTPFVTGLKKAKGLLWTGAPDSGHDQSGDGSGGDQGSQGQG